MPELGYPLGTPAQHEPLAIVLPTMRTRGVRGVSGNGVLGDPCAATAAHYTAVFSTICDALTARVAALFQG